MKFLFASILLISSSVAYTINLGPESKRMPSWRVVMNELDEDVPQGKFTIKINPSEKSTLYVHNGDDWAKYAVLKEGDKNIFSLDSGHYRLKIEAPGKQTVTRRLHAQGGYYMEVDVYLYKPRPVGVKKPVIYVYAPETMDVSLKIKPVGEFTFTYPQHEKDGWNFTANSDGTLEIADKTYDYLFWEGEQEQLTVDTDYGYCVAGVGVVEFLEEKLSALGFNDREMQDFITFWAPIMQENPYNYVNFVVGDKYDTKIASYDSSVEFESELRVFMAYEPLNDRIDVKEQDLPAFERSGLSLVEWGGGEISQINESIQSL